MHANLCMHILASMIQDGSNQFPVTRLPVLNSVTDSSRHFLLLTSLHRLWSVSLASLWYRRPHVRMCTSIGYLEPLVIFTNVR